MWIRWMDRLQWAVIAAMFSAGLWRLLQLPDGAQVPLHFDGAMRPDRWGSPWFGLLSLPVVALGVWALQRYLGAGSKQGSCALSTSISLALLRVGVTLLLAALQFHTIQMTLAA